MWMHFSCCLYTNKSKALNSNNITGKIIRTRVVLSRKWNVKLLWELKSEVSVRKENKFQVCWDVFRFLTNHAEVSLKIKEIRNIWGGVSVLYIYTHHNRNLTRIVSLGVASIGTRDITLYTDNGRIYWDTWHYFVHWQWENIFGHVTLLCALAVREYIGTRDITLYTGSGRIYWDTWHYFVHWQWENILRHVTLLCTLAVWEYAAGSANGKEDFWLVRYCMFHENRSIVLFWEAWRSDMRKKLHVIYKIKNLYILLF